MILEQIYEVDFLRQFVRVSPPAVMPSGAIGARPRIIGDSKKVNWISDADIKGFFDNVCHERLEELLRIRISDPKLLAVDPPLSEAPV